MVSHSKYSITTFNLNTRVASNHTGYFFKTDASAVKLDSIVSGLFILLLMGGAHVALVSG